MVMVSSEKARFGRRLSLLVTLGATAGCQVEASGQGTGGVDAAAFSTDGGSEGGASCSAGIAVVATDALWASTQVALLGLDGALLSASFMSTASAQTDGLAFALSGDVSLPTTPPASDRLVLLDRYGTNVITWVDVQTARPLNQLAVGTGFNSNPQDYLELGDGRALVSRWGVDGTPGDVAQDGGSDVLVLDVSATPTILGRIPIPSRDGIPPRPERMTRVGSKVAVVLERLSEDFATYGDAEIALVDPATAVVQSLPQAGVADCSHLVPRPGGGYGLTCTGPLDSTGKSDLTRSALVLYAEDGAGGLVEERRLSPTELLLPDAFQHELAFLSRDVALVTTQTAYGGVTNNRLLAVDLTNGTTQTLAEARPGTDGKGQGLTFGTVLCTPGCSDVCLLADGDLGRVRRFSFGGADAATELDPVDLAPGVGLFPRELSHFGALP